MGYVAVVVLVVWASLLACAPKPTAPVPKLDPALAESVIQRVRHARLSEHQTVQGRIWTWRTNNGVSPPHWSVTPTESGWRVSARLYTWNERRIEFVWWVTPSGTVQADGDSASGTARFPTTADLTPELPVKP
jgi:hypothetical protein